MRAFQDKVAVVTGAASGIGKAIAVFLAGHGAKVVLVDRDVAGARSLADQIRSQGGNAEPVCADVSSADDVRAFMDAALTFHGRIDYLFNNAGISVNGEFQDISADDWNRVFGVNLWGVVHACRAVFPVMMKQGSGHIVNTASLAGLIPGGLTTPYSASKHAVVGFTLTLRGEAKQYGIRVSALCPGYIRTNIQKTTPTVTAYLNSEKNTAAEAKMKFLTAEDCVAQIMRGVRRNRGIIFSPNRHRIYWWLNRIAPEFIPNMWDVIIRHLKKNT